MINSKKTENVILDLKANMEAFLPLKKEALGNHMALSKKDLVDLSELILESKDSLTWLEVRTDQEGIRLEIRDEVVK